MTFKIKIWSYKIERGFKFYVKNDDEIRRRFLSRSSILILMSTYFNRAFYLLHGLNRNIVNMHIDLPRLVL